MPRIGYGQPSHGRPLSEREATLVRALRPAHLRVDVHAVDGIDADALATAAADADAVGAELELAVFANDGSADALDRLAARLATLEARVARVLVYHFTTGFSAMLGLTPASVVRLARDRLERVTGPVVFAGGTNQNFSDINRDRPTDPTLTGVCFSISPTVHAADDASIVENLAGQSEVIRMTRAFAGDRAVCVSPVTIATRFGPYPAGPSGPDDLPAAVDVRQASLLGAAWTAGSIKHLAESGASSVTYYETTGWRGVLETDEGPPDGRFPSRPGSVFPMYHVLADVGEWREGSVRRVTSDRPLEVEALAVEDVSGLHLLVANVSPTATTARLLGLDATSVAVRLLDASVAERAMSDPDGYRASARDAVEVGAGAGLLLDLPPYAVARVDVTEA